MKQIKKKGHGTSNAFAIATAALQKSGSLKKGHKPTKKGIARGNMTEKNAMQDTLDSIIPRRGDWYGSQGPQPDYSDQVLRTSPALYTFPLTG